MEFVLQWQRQVTVMLVDKSIDQRTSNSYTFAIYKDGLQIFVQNV